MEGGEAAPVLQVDRVQEEEATERDEGGDRDHVAPENGTLAKKRTSIRGSTRRRS